MPQVHSRTGEHVARRGVPDARSLAHLKVLQGGTPGAYLSSFTALAQLPDLYVGELKAVVFGALAAIVASYKGLTAGGGPKGVGDAVNQSVVITFMLLFVVNFVMSTIYLELVPPKTG